MATSGSDSKDTPGDGGRTLAADEGVLTHDQVFGDILQELGGAARAAARPLAPAVALRRGPIRVQLPEPAEGRAGRVRASGGDRLDDLMSEIRAREAKPRFAGPSSGKSMEEMFGVEPLLPRRRAPVLPAIPARPRVDVEELLELPPQPPALERAAGAGAVAPQVEPPEDALDLVDLVDEAAGSPQPAARSVPPVGMFGRFELLERIAGGSMAEVYRARGTGPGGSARILAVKRILPHLATNPGFVEIFVNEAKMVSRLDHPNIVAVLELGHAEHSYYIAMEHVDGRDLRTILERLRSRGRRMPLALTVLIGRKLCAALDYAHRARDDDGRGLRIVHGDITPQNVLVSYEGNVKLADFGIARAASRAAAADDALLRGKLFYMSPEQASGGRVDGRSDVFSLGIVLYEMMTGVRPFTGGDQGALIDALRGGRVRSPANLNPGIPDRLSAVILKALERSPENRFPDAAALSIALDRSLERPGPRPSDLARFMEDLFPDRHPAEVIGVAPPPGPGAIERNQRRAPSSGLALHSLEQLANPGRRSRFQRAWRKIFG